MEKSTKAHLKELVAENRLEEALNLMIAQEQIHGLERHNTLLLLKGKWAMIKEQEMAGLLDMDEAMQQKLKIAHSVLNMLDEKPIESPDAPIQTTKSIDVQKTRPAAVGSPVTKYLFMGIGILLAGFFLFWIWGRGQADSAAGDHSSNQPKTEQTGQAETDEQQSGLATDRPLRVLNFPNLKKPFNFLDFGLEFVWAEAEWISDSEIRLKIRYYLTCKSNLGICYRAAIRIHADGRAIAPDSQSNLDGWIDHDVTATDDVTFVLPAETNDFLLVFSRDHSTWKRPFKILSK